jgi:hypothetical protein
MEIEKITPEQLVEGSGRLNQMKLNIRTVIAVLQSVLPKPVEIGDHPLFTVICSDNTHVWQLTKRSATEWRFELYFGPSGEPPLFGESDCKTGNARLVTDHLQSLIDGLLLKFPQIRERLKIYL